MPENSPCPPMYVEHVAQGLERNRPNWQSEVLLRLPEPMNKQRQVMPAVHVFYTKAPRQDPNKGGLGFERKILGEKGFSERVYVGR
mmetsp:Transcript_2480/g.5406  ORF Transcript_2480/g.5406 Transcript_2480/m.5406 type:complete len:86 (+) Transcript_2480:538-795(+)